MRTMGRMGRMGLMGLMGGMLACAVMITACAEPKAEWRGQQMTSAQVQAEIERAVRQAEAQARTDAETLARQAAARLAAFEIAVARADAEHGIQLAELRAAYQADKAASEDALSGVQRRTEEAMESIRADAAAHRAAIESQWDTRDLLASILGPAAEAGASFVPGLSAVIATLGGGTGIAGLLLGSRNKKRSLSKGEALAAALAAAAMLPEPARSAFEAALRSQATTADMNEIAAVRKADELHDMPTIAG